MGKWCNTHQERARNDTYKPREPAPRPHTESRNQRPRIEPMSDDTEDTGNTAANNAIKVVVSPSLSKDHDRRYVIIDATTGDVLDDAQGHGYKTAQNAHRAYAYMSIPPEKKRGRKATKQKVQRWCANHPEFMHDVEQTMLYAIKDGDTITTTDVGQLLTQHGLTPPFSIDDLMRHW